MEERSFLSLVFSLSRILFLFLTFFENMDSTVEVSFALVMIIKSFIFHVFSISVYHNIVQVAVEF